MKFLVKTFNSFPIKKSKLSKLQTKVKLDFSLKYTSFNLKIKTNNTKVLDARPNTGLIAPGAQSKITVKRAEEVANNLKLQISSIECKE